MTHDIIRMAFEVGFTEFDLLEGVSEMLVDFAALVAAAEREACTELLLEIKRKCQDADRLWQIEEFVDEVVRARGGP
jgi:hypothetical protein